MLWSILDHRGSLARVSRYRGIVFTFEGAAALRRRGFSFLLICAVFAATSADARCLSADETATKTAIVGYASNLDSFVRYKCRYTVTAATATSFEDAKAGRWSNRSVSEHRLVVDGDMILYESQAEPPHRPGLVEEVRAKGRAGTPVPVMPHAYVAKGRRSFGYTAALSSINLFDDESFPGSPPTLTPLGLCGHRFRGNRMGPDAMLADNDAYHIVVSEVIEHEGRPVMSIRFDKRATPDKNRFDLDPSAGYLPVYRSRDFQNGKGLGGQPSERFLVKSVRPCSRGRFFPTHILFVRTPPKDGQGYQVRDLEVTELDVDEKPSDEDFSLRVPAGTTVSSDLDYSRHFQLKQEETVGPAQVDALFEIWNRNSPGTRFDTGIQARSRGRIWWWVGLSIALIVGLLGLSRRLRRLQMRGN